MSVREVFSVRVFRTSSPEHVISCAGNRACVRDVFPHRAGEADRSNVSEVFLDCAGDAGRPRVGEVFLDRAGEANCFCVRELFPDRGRKPMVTVCVRCFQSWVGEAYRLPMSSGVSSRGLVKPISRRCCEIGLLMPIARRCRKVFLDVGWYVVRDFQSRTEGADSSSMS